MNIKVKDFQPRGNYGYRDIYRRPLMLPIPKFNRQTKDHVALSTLSSDCHDIVKHHKFVKKGFKGMRNESMKLLSNRLEEIDVIVQRLLI